MADKYEDLDNVILEDLGIPEVSKGVAFGIQLALQWLDGHHDQAPRRTLTRSDMVEAFGEDYAGWATHRLARVGYTVIPDAEPTNEEKWKKFIRESNSALSESDVEDMAAHMDQFDVTAPGGDDER